MSDDIQERIAQEMRESAPIAVKVLFEGATDQALSRTQRLKLMKALANRPDLAREFLTAAQLREFGASIKTIADDPGSSVAQQNQAQRLLSVGSRHGLWVYNR